MNTIQSTSILPANAWHPFRLGPKAEPVRALTHAEGVADRLRVVAFAELQAREAFLLGARRFPEAPARWRDAWVSFAAVEDRHARMLLQRMEELGVEPGGRLVSDRIWQLCQAAPDWELFFFLLASAEERGMESGFTLAKLMQPVDATSAALFEQIAREEVEHVELAKAAIGSLPADAMQARARSLNATL